MRTTKLVSRATAAFTHEATPIRSRNLQYTCKACQTSNQQQRTLHHHQQQRSVRSQPPTRHLHTTKPVRHTSNSTGTNHPPPPISTPPKSHYDLFPQTFPTGPPPATPFTPDLRALRQEYLHLQSQAHPDRAPAAQKAQYEALSSLINEAYKTLQDPLRRAQYLLAQRGIDVEDESAKLSEVGLLTEVMEAREAVDEAESEEELEASRTENRRRIEGSVGVLEGTFAREEWEAAAQEAIRLRYWMNIEESIQGWEKGVGGGAIHH